MDAMYKLEHGSDDVQKGQDKKRSLAQLESSRFSMKDDYMLNRMARDKFRVRNSLRRTIFVLFSNHGGKEIFL